MGRTASFPELLEVCIQDLHAGRRLAADKLETVAAAAGSALAPIVAGVRDEFADEARQLEKTGKDLDGPENLWMGGITDDAVRDTESIEAGPLLDTAIIGAVRKALAADEVSLETASALARSLGESELCAQLEAMRERRRDADDKLRQFLHDLHG